MKTQRLLSLAFYMLNHRSATTVGLADKFNVSVRTILRDIDELSLAGIPLFTKQGRNGGVFLMDSFNLRTTSLSNTEVMDVMRILEGAKGIHSGLEVDALADKLLLAKNVPNIKKVVMDFSPLEWDVSGLIDEKWEKIRNAIEAQTVLNIDYINNAGIINSRNVEPLTLVYRVANWYLYAYCQNKQGMRIFKLARMIKLRNTGKNYVRKTPEWENSFFSYDMDKGDKLVNFRLKVEKNAITQAIDEFTTDCVNIGKTHGTVNCTWPKKLILNTVLKLGSNVTVLSPIWLVQAYKNTAKTILQKHNT